MAPRQAQEDVRVMAEFLALVHIGICTSTQGGIFMLRMQSCKGNAGVGVGTRGEHYAIVGEAYFLQLVDKFALDVALIVFYLTSRVFSLQLWQIALERVTAIKCLGS